MGGIPQGDYAPVPFLHSSRRYAVWLETTGPGALFDLTDAVSCARPVVPRASAPRPAARVV